MQNLEEAFNLIEESREAALATFENSRPFNSAAAYFFRRPGPDTGKFGKVVLLMSELARHTKNIRKESRVSLLITESGNQPAYQKKRVSVQGEILEATEPSLRGEYKRRYLELFPDSKIFFTLADFKFFELEIAELYYVGGFGKIESFS